MGCNAFMADVAAGQPLYENTWLAAGSILLLLVILGSVLVGLVLGGAWIVRWIARRPRLRRWIWPALAVAGVMLSIPLGSTQQIYSHNDSSGMPINVQNVVQQHLSQDERALDKGVLTYTALPSLKTDEPTTLTASVTDLGKHPDGGMTAQAYSEPTGLAVYSENVPTGGIVGLHLTCTNIYCQALSSARQAIVGTDTSRSWSWNLTPLRPGPTSVIITASTYDGISSIVLNQEIIPVSVKVEKGPWWAAFDDWWHAMTSFTATTAGLITTVGGAVAVIAGGAGWVRRRRIRKAQTQPERNTLPEVEASTGQETPVGAENLCHQVIFVEDAAS